MTTTASSRKAPAMPRHASPTLGLLRDGCRRHGQPALLYLVVWAFILLRVIYQARFDPGTSAATLLSGLGVTGVIMTSIFAWVAAAANFRLLYSRGAAELYGALPVSRPRLFLAGLGATLVPLVASACVLALMLLAFSGIAGLSAPAIGQWFLLQVLLLIAFCGIAVGCLQLVGRYVIGFVVYLMANFYAIVVNWGLWALNQLAIPSLLIGGRVFLDWASPAWYLAQALAWSDTSCLMTPLSSWTTWARIATYALVGVVLMALSCLLFCHRDMEHAGDAFAFRPAYAVTTVLFSVGAGLGLTLILMGGIFLGGDVLWSSSIRGTAGPILGTSLVVLTLAVLVVVEAIMGRTLRAVRQHVATLVATAAVAVVAALVFTADVTGAAHYVPKASDVESASAQTVLPLALTNEDAIESLIEFHQALIDAQDDTTLSASDISASTYAVYIDYHMGDGSTLQRRYYVDEGGTDTVSKALDTFLGSQAIKDQLADTIEDALSTNASKEVVTLEGTSDIRAISQEDFPSLMSALEADVQEHGIACISYYDPEVEPSSLDYDATISLDGPFSGPSQEGQNAEGSLVIYLNRQVTPNTYDWVSRRYGTDVLSSS